MPQGGITYYPGQPRPLIPQYKGRDQQHSHPRSSRGKSVEKHTDTPRPGHGVEKELKRLQRQWAKQRKQAAQEEENARLFSVHEHGNWNNQEAAYQIPNLNEDPNEDPLPDLNQDLNVDYDGASRDPNAWPWQGGSGSGTYGQGGGGDAGHGRRGYGYQ
jgi:hypothetical protein